MNGMEMRRRAMMGSMGAIAIGPWKTKQVTAEINTMLANQVKDWIISIIPPNTSIAYLINNESDKTLFTQYMLFVAIIESGVPKAYIRMYSGNYNGQTGWTTSYSLIIKKGETYTILYQ